MLLDKCFCSNISHTMRGMDLCIFLYTSQCFCRDDVHIVSTMMASTKCTNNYCKKYKDEKKFKLKRTGLRKNIKDLFHDKGQKRADK